MRAVRRRLRACAWLALLSIAALAFGPTVSRILLPAGDASMSGAEAHARAQPAMGAATASALVHQHQYDMAMGRAMAAREKPHVPMHEHTLEHCGLCLLAAQAFTFVHDQPALGAFVECTRAMLAPVAPAVPRPRSDWSPASSRGPPPHA
jgi:hypothetical protein